MLKKSKEYDQPHTAPCVAGSEHRETCAPGYNGYHDYVLYAELPDTERQQENTERLAYLGDRDERVCIAGSPGPGKFREPGERAYVQIAVRVGNLEGDSD